MSVPKSEHKVYIYKKDYHALCTEVYMRQNIETGGNLFGMWKNFGSAVIHVVLGPGQHCRRTSTSFQQDVEYMERVGRFVNDRYSLCHIGEWRSHHRLSLNKPSAEEEHYIRRIFPQGMSKFLVIIANVKNGDTIVLSPYFFTDCGQRYEKAEYVVLESDSTFSLDYKILAEVEHGAEVSEYQRNETNEAVASLTVTEISRNVASNSQRENTSSSTHSQAASRRSHVKSRNTVSRPQRHDSTYSTHSLATLTSGQPSGDNANDISSMDVSQDAKSHAVGPKSPVDHTAAQTTNNPPGNDTVQNQTARNENERPTTKEVVMKDTYDELEKYFGQGKVEMERTRYDDINMIFEHESYHWMLRFPKTFPDQPAQLFRASMRRHLSSSSPCSHYLLEKPLTNRVNILLSIKKNCWSICKICESITKEKLTKPAAAVIPDNTKLADTL